MGANVFPIIPGTKRPATGRWEHLHTEQQTAAEIEALDWTGSLACVAGPGGWRAIDVDHSNPVGHNTLSATVKDILEELGLPEEYEWIVRSGAGYHIWVRCEEELPGGSNMYTERQTYYSEPFTVEEVQPDGTIVQKTMHTDCVGLFFRKKYVLLPPSSHETNPEGYRFVSGRLPANPPALLSASTIIAAVENVIYTPVVYSAEGEATSEEYVESGVPNMRYGAGVLKGIWKELSETHEFRDNTLMSKAFKVGMYVAGGSIDRQEAIDKLIDACTINGLLFDRGSGGLAGITDKIGRAFKSAAFHPRYSPVEKEAAPSGDYLLDLDASDRGHAAAVLHRYPDQVKYTGAVGWLVWNGTHYETDSEARVGQMIADTLQARREAAVKGEHSEKNEQIIRQCVTNHMRMRDVKAELSDLAHAKIKDFDSTPDLLNVENGVLNLRTGQLTPHQPGQLFTYCLETRWNPNASPDQWAAFVRGAVKGGEEMVSFLQRAVGYSLTGHTREEHMFYIYGPSRAGKGVFVETLRALLGGSLSAGVPFTTFTQKREGQNFDLARLKASRLVVASESSRYQRLNGEMVKDITGGGAIAASFKHKDTFEYKPDFKIWVTSNFPVNGDPDDDALWGRIHVVEFPNSHLGNEDTGMKARMQSQECLEGLLVWAVKGAQAWYEEGRLVAPAVSTEAKDTHREQADSVGLWLAECCEVGEGKFTATRRARASYEQWCEENGFEAKGAKTFNESLTRRGMGTNKPGRDSDYGRGEPCKGIKGLALIAA
jgi:putative DNA primase/helicase